MLTRQINNRSPKLFVPKSAIFLLYASGYELHFCELYFKIFAVFVTLTSSFFFFQHWKDISTLAKDFINKTMALDPNERLTASQAIKHPWLTRSSDQTSGKNLQTTISQNLLQLESKSSRSSRSSKSTPSSKSSHSLRSDRRKVQPEDVEELLRDPEVQAELESLRSQHSNSS